jgi:hypothetical protein
MQQVRAKAPSPPCARRPWMGKKSLFGFEKQTNHLPEILPLFPFYRKFSVILWCENFKGFRVCPPRFSRPP